MNVSHPFILRPIATTLLIVGVVLLGGLGYRLLPVAALPSVDFPTIQVVTAYPGAAPEIMASSITTPLEHQLGTISGLTSMSSTSSFGNSQITLQFDLSRDINSAAQDVQSQINAAQGIIPSSKLPNPPTYSKVNPADTPILILALTSDTLPLRTVNDYTDTVVAQKLSQVEGVGVVTIEGGQKEAVRIQLNPTQIANLGLALDDVRTAISSSTVDLAKGSIDGARQSFQIGADDQLFDANGYRNQILAYRNSAPIRLKDVAAVVDGVENDKLAGWYNGRPAVILDIQRQPGANIIETVASIRKLMPKLKAALPPSIKIDVLTDRTETIRASVADVQFTLVLTIALVVLVIFLFLRKFWATVIPSVTLPVSLIATFGIMSLCGFSLDNLSLMALTIASGFVVDDAIVMIENIVRFIEAGETPLQAALKGAKQIGFTIISLTVSLIAVFIPLLLMGGVIGRLFREFAITLSAAVVISAIVSLTLTPMMCAKLLKPEDPDHQPGALFRWSERFFDWLRDGYDAGLRWVLRHQTVTLVFTVLTIGVTALLYIEVPKGFLPQQDTGLIVGVTDAAQDISFNGMAQRQQAIAAEVMKDPDVVAVDSFVGTGTVNTTPNSGRLYINLKPRDQRTTSSDEIIERLKDRVAGVHGITLYMQSVQDIQIDNRLSRTQYQYTMQDANVAELGQWVPKLVAELRRQPELIDVATDQQNAGLQALVKIDRDAAARLGVSMQSIDDTLYDAFGQRQIATIYTQLNQYHVILSIDPSFQKDKNGLDKIYVEATNGSLSNGTQLSNGVVASTTPTSNGSQTTSNTATTTSLNTGKGTEVPLSSVATIVTQLAPLVVTHQGLFPATTLSFNVPEGTSLGAALTAIQRSEQAIGLPETIATGFSGSAAEFRSSLDSELGLILAAIVTVYIVLGVLYESYIHPITILSTLPSAGVGALLSLMLFHQDLSVISLIGIILLIGIVKKNAIMMIDFALDAERQGMTPHDAIYQACLLRFRPIMMTTMAALLGALPLAIGTGTGSELRRPLGIAIVGGLIVSQFLTLYTTPVIYLFFERVRLALLRRFGAKPAQPQRQIPLPFNAVRDPDAAE